MGKRKTSAPQKSSESKRQALTWIMGQHNLKNDASLPSSSGNQSFCSSQQLSENVDLIILDETEEDLEEGHSSPDVIILDDCEKKSGNSVLPKYCNDASRQKTVILPLVKKKESRQQPNDEILNNYLSLNNSFIPIYKKRTENEKWKRSTYLLGHLILEVSSENTDILQNMLTSVLYLYFGSSMKSCLLYWEEEEDGKKTAGYCPVTCQADYYSLRALSKKKTLMLMLAENSLKQGLLYIEIYLKEIFSLQYPSQPVHSSVNTDFQSLMKVLFGIDMPVCKDHLLKERHDVEALYSTVRSLQISDEKNTENTSKMVQHPLLVPTLRPYQRSAVNWMLEKEQRISDISSKLHPLFIEIQTPSQNTLYYNKYGGFFVEEKPLELPSYPGGILADEMGLGKTVEVLACILCHPWPQLNVIKLKESKENDLEVISEVFQAERETLEVVEPDTLKHHSSVLDNSNSYSLEEAANESENRVYSSILNKSHVKKEEIECFSSHDINN